jgi:hypothetical protein
LPPFFAASQSPNSQSAPPASLPHPSSSHLYTR